MKQIMLILALLSGATCLIGSHVDTKAQKEIFERESKKFCETLQPLLQNPHENARRICVLCKDTLLSCPELILTINLSFSEQFCQVLGIPSNGESIFKQLIENTQHKDKHQDPQDKMPKTVDVCYPKIFIDLYREELTRASVANPIFFLSECIDPGYMCELGRPSHPEKRKQFEEYVVSQAIEILSKKKHLEYVTFGSGLLFQDLVIITKILEKQPNADISVCCIDLQYNAYVDVQNYLKQGKTLERDFIRPLSKLPILARNYINQRLN